MKEISATGKGLFRLLNLVFPCKPVYRPCPTPFAHKVSQCFRFQGETVTIHTQVSAIGYNSYIHWQYQRLLLGHGPISQRNNLINGRNIPGHRRFATYFY